ncbi:hypothetical protein Leryth_023712 [Lithospermum erythrorhizon]|nr:hypothetical protein Leryth_023712 [Lithospermum erythrorhizon]
MFVEFHSNSFIWEARFYCGFSIRIRRLVHNQWNLLAVCLFFCTGHWCAFDGLRYAAAFTGFDEFNLIRQAVLLTIETFGFSRILPIVGLPFLVAHQHRAADKGTEGHVLQLSLVYLIYGLTIVIGVTFTILMVWGVFVSNCPWWLFCSYVWHHFTTLYSMLQV